MSENVTGPTLHEKPAASYTLTEAVAHAAAKADDAPSNGDIPKIGPTASAAKAKYLGLFFIGIPGGRLNGKDRPQPISCKIIGQVSFANSSKKTITTR